MFFNYGYLSNCPKQLFIASLCGVISVSILSASNHTAIAAPIVPAPTQASTTGDVDLNTDKDLKAALKMMVWLPAADSLSTQMVEYLKTKVGKEVVRPDYPKTNLIYWHQGRYPMLTLKKAQDKEQAQLIYTLIYEDTLVLQHLMKAIAGLQNGLAPIDQKKQQVLRQRANEIQDIAYRNYQWASLGLGDKWLGARLVETFMLRHLEYAPTEPTQYLNVESLVETAAGAFWEAKEPEKQAAILKVLIKLAYSQNNADATRAKLAEALASQSKYSEALSVLQPIKDPSISNLKKVMIANFQKKLTAQTKTALPAAHIQ